MLSSLVLCGELCVSVLCSVAVQRLAALLDPPHPRGSDWCVLGVKLGLQLLLPSLDKQPASASPTAALLHAYGQQGGSLGALVRELRAMEREDAALVVMRSSPLYQVSAPDAAAVSAADSPLVSATSSTNLSR